MRRPFNTSVLFIHGCKETRVSALASLSMPLSANNGLLGTIFDI
jgi:hypothetical protein